MKRFLLLFGLILYCSLAFSQGRTHRWLTGHLNNKARITITDSSFNFVTVTRKQNIQTTHGNISDELGNLLMSSNGIWIANANGDTMLNGSGLNPGSFVNSNPSGLLLPYANLFLPWPGDSTRYALFHHTIIQDGIANSAHELFMTTIDMTLDGGLGGVTQKNQVVLQDTLPWGIAATRHANGRDWWVVMLKDNSDLVYTVLFTPNGIKQISTQNLYIFPVHYAGTLNPMFSPNGEKFAYTNTSVINNKYNLDVRILDFDRCSGMFSNGTKIQLVDSLAGYGIAFSSDSRFLYASSREQIYQINLDTVNIAASVLMVAQNDLFYSPFPPFRTDFHHLYLAANGKIYITSGNSVRHLHTIESPLVRGSGCNVQLHNIDLGIIYFRTVPNHPNYYLGALAGSVCDSLGVGIQELQVHDFRFSVSPNPSNGNFRMLYLLPQNQSGVLEVFDVNGRRVYAMNLPQWSTIQEVILPDALTGGVYSCVVTSGGQRAVKKVVLLR